MAIDLGGTKCSGALASLDGATVAERCLRVAEAGSAAAALDTMVDTLLDQASASGWKVTAAAAGVPAVVDPDTLTAHRGPNVGWEDVAAAAPLAELGLPFRVENDVNLSALAEAAEGHAQGVTDFAVISLGTGLGGAVVSAGQLLQGAHHAAGELGVMVPNLADLARHFIGGPGGLEQVVTGPAIERAARDCTALGPGPAATTVIAAALAGEPAAVAIVAPVVEALAACIVNLAAVTDPGLVVLDGSVGRALAGYLPQLDAAVARHVPQAPRLAVSSLEPSSVLRGAVRAALDLVGGTP
jgi:glucokinase